MNYQRIHDQIIARAKSEDRCKIKGGVYYERHHIIPKCLGGNNTKENLVLLTGREHFLVHWLLAEIHQIDKLWFAFNSMCILTKDKRYVPSSRVVGFAKEENSKNLSKLFKGIAPSDKCIAAVKLANTGRKQSEMQKQALHIANKGKKITAEHKNAISLKNNGRKLPPKSEEYYQKMSNIRWSEEAKLKVRGRKRPPEAVIKSNEANYKAVLKFDLLENFICKYNSIKEAAKDCCIPYTGISACLHNKYNRKTAGGYKWKFA